jgi:hypothetical protein
MRVRIHWPAGEVTGELHNNATAARLAEALPITSQAHTWGDEVYFEAGVEAQLDNAPQVVVPYGTLCYWVQGEAVAIPFGPTPISEGNESRLVTAVNVIGALDGDAGALASVREGDTIVMERVPA